ncbi:hypothetical protein MKW92_017496 [Papaver armeniacum]|nr:hypothetical protein MKW92_017496 [Papaver armeniacum]
MAIIRTKAPHQLFACFTVLAVAICLFVSTEMASAWNNICNPGDLYIDSNNPTSQPSCDNGYCTNWCKRICSEMGVLATQDRCNAVSGSTQCKCCCQTKAQSPCDPPYPTPGPSDFDGPAPYDYNICTSDQTLQKVKRTDGNDCMRTSQCEAECSKIGLLAARKECVANTGDGAGTNYNWYEQCCCGTTIPPPPPPCPPPPPPPCPCSCCNTDVNVTISIKSGQASIGQSTSPPSLAHAEL